MIHWIPGEKVVLDRNLAELYGVETRALKQAIRRNPERFPSDFTFPLMERDVRGTQAEQRLLQSHVHG